MNHLRFSLKKRNSSLAMEEVESRKSPLVLLGGGDRIWRSRKPGQLKHARRNA